MYIIIGSILLTIFLLTLPLFVISSDADEKLEKLEKLEKNKTNDKQTNDH